MKLLSYRALGRTRFGVKQGGSVVDLTDRLNNRFADLKAVIAAGALAEAARTATGATPDFSLDEIIFDPVITDPKKIVCIALNYETHRAEGNRPKSDHPATFIRFPDSQMGHLQPAIRPNVSDAFDYEGELAVVIGKACRYIPAERALEYVAGYACYNDISVRDFQKHTAQLTAGKNFPSTGAFGPYLVTPDEVGELEQKKIETRLNGKVVQSSTLGMMIFSVAKLIEYVSTCTPLSPGDVIATGTPGGVGMACSPPLWMKPGDWVEVEIESVGLLKTPVAAEHASVT